MALSDTNLGPFYLLNPVAETHVEPYFVNANWRLRIRVALEDGNELLDRYNEREGIKPMFKAKGRVSLTVEAEHCVAGDSQEWVAAESRQPVYMNLDNILDHIPLPPCPEGLELDELQTSDLLHNLKLFLAEQQGSGWGMFTDWPESNNYWPNPAYVEYLIRACRMEHKDLAARLGVSDRTMRSWADVYDKRTISYPAQYTLERVAQCQLLDRGSFED